MGIGAGFCMYEYDVVVKKVHVRYLISWWVLVFFLYYYWDRAQPAPVDRFRTICTSYHVFPRKEVPFGIAM